MARPPAVAIQAKHPGPVKRRILVEYHRASRRGADRRDVLEPDCRHRLSGCVLHRTRHQIGISGAWSRASTINVDSAELAGVIAIVGLLIFSNVTASINQDSFSTAQNSTAAKIKDTTLDSFELGVVALIVLAAVVILATVYMLGR